MLQITKIMKNMYQGVDLGVFSEQYGCKTRKGGLMYDNNIIQTFISSTQSKLLIFFRNQNHTIFTHFDRKCE